MRRTLGTVDWGPLFVALPPLVLFAAGAYHFFEERSFLSDSAPTTAVITAMKDVGTQEGYQLCYATLKYPVGSTWAQAKVRLGGYWPESGGGCAKVADNLAVRYRLTDPTDVRPAAAMGSDAQALLIVGPFFSVPLFLLCGFALVEWWSSRASRIRPRSVI